MSPSGPAAPLLAPFVQRVGARRWAFAAAALVATAVGAAAIVRADIAARREAFAAEARIAHRLLSQRAAQLDAVLSTLVLMAPGPAGSEQGLTALWPSVRAVARREPGKAWPALPGPNGAPDALAAAEAQSRALPATQRHAVLGPVDTDSSLYTVVQAGEPISYALQVDARRLVPADEWPLADDGPTRAVLQHGGHSIMLHSGTPDAQQPAGLTPGFTFSKMLASPSQPFELQLQRATGPAQWPWRWLLGWALACAAAATAAHALAAARLARRRSAELMRLAQVARLNTLGELAAGMAHEINQPLTAVLASTQAAGRLLGSASSDHSTGSDDDEGPDLPAARQALALAAAQARRAADVVARLRRLVQDPTRGMVLQAVDLQALATQMLQLLAPELQRRGISAQLQGQAPPVWGDPVALEQIVHNLVGNAMQALQAAAAPAVDRVAAPLIQLQLQPLADRQVQLRVLDNGPGIAEEDRDRVFQPFFSTREGGLGLGLPLCQSLAQAMGGDLAAQAPSPPGPGGAALVLTLPQAPRAAAKARFGATVEPSTQTPPHTPPHASRSASPGAAPPAPPHPAGAG